MDERRRTDWVGMMLGAAVFLLGIALLLFTFYQALLMFSLQPEDIISRKNTDVTELGAAFGHIVLRIGLLIVMSIVGSVISGKGVRMYFAARMGSRENEKP